MEALCYGMPLVATAAGSSGVNIPFQNHLFIANLNQEFVEIIDSLFKDSKLLKTTSVNAHNWVTCHKEKIRKDLLW